MTIAAYTEIPHKSQHRDPVLIQDMIPVLKQNNYTNLFCQTAGKQLTRIKEMVSHVKKSCKLEPKPTDVEPVIIKPTPVLRDFKLKSKEETEFMDTLLSRIKNLHISEPPLTSTSQVNMLSNTNPLLSDDSLDHISPQEIFEIQQNFQPSSVNRVTYGPSTQRLSLSAPNCNTIYEWNINGLSEYQIYELLQQMLMFATVCKQNNNSDHQVACYIVSGFTGVLKGWWDNILTPTQCTEILSFTHTVLEIDPAGPSTGPAAAQVERQEEDAVYTLINTIITHFIGQATGIADRNRELLMKLRCPSLSHFRWYKDVFLMKVMQRADRSAEHWKAKFIDSLPTLFAERVRKKLRDRHRSISIPYYQYTYGQLVGLVTDEGLALCNDLKLQQQLKQQQLTGKKELGKFCEQFAYDPQIQYPHKQRKHKSYSKPPKKYRKYSKPKVQSQSQTFKPRYTSRTKGTKGKPFQKNKSSIKCYKCGQIGHYANKCRAKIQSKLNELALDDDTQQKILQLISDSSSSSDPSDNELAAIYSDSSEQETNDNPENEICPCKTVNQVSDDVNYWKAIGEMNGLNIGPSINVLTDSEQNLLEIADGIKDPATKLKFLEMCYN
ncbi:uncharacterized protein LOC114292817 [Camellia sinensis]|uniref:uncharacterized protein LOC114292817 n=1 Tax=Camellia sinensis TaxID=4442 RepID=UPI001035CB5D|nr:uncharacterized protein LOC114292817 [Camellia sinensis]